MTLILLDRFRSRHEPPPRPVFEGLAQVRAYWEGLREAGQLPQRAAFDPRGLSGMLDRVFLAERIGRGLVQLQFAGSGLADFTGMDIRGLPLSCLFKPESRPLLSQCVESVFDTPAVVEMDLGANALVVGSPLARLLLLPMADRAGNKLVLGTISFATGASTCKFQILTRHEEALSVSDAKPVAVAPPVQPIRRVGHLALVHSAG